MSLPEAAHSLRLRIYVLLFMHCEVTRGLDVQLEPLQGELSPFLQLQGGVTVGKKTAGDPFDPILPQLAVCLLESAFSPREK